MKKKSLILLSSLFLLAGCTTTPTTSSSSSRPSSSSSISASNCTTSLPSSTSSSTSTSTSSSSSSSTTPSSSTSSSTSTSTSSTTSSSSTSSIDQNLVAKKEEVSNYIASLSYDAYREAEQETLRTLVSSMQGVLNDSNDVDEIDAVFSAFKTQVSELKTKAQYEQEEAEELAKQLEQKKQEVLAKIEISSPTQYRSKEINELLAIQDTLKNQINAATSIEALEAIDLSSLSNAIATAKTNAMYTMEEILPFGEDAGWDLVNAHRDQMVLNEDKTITTKDDGYALDSTKYSGDMEVVFSVNADTYQSLSGLLFATKTSVSGGDGLDGFTLNIARGAGFEYIQVYHIDNFYGATTGSYEYIGGWVFTDDYPGEKVVNTELRAKISGTTLKIFKEADYQKYGENAKVCAVDLSFGGKYTVATERQLGIITWGNNGVPFTLKLSMLAGSTYIDGKEHAIELATNYFAKVDTTKYDTETASNINAKKASILGLAEDIEATYEDIISAINELKVMVKEADNYLANGAKIRATALMDAIFSTDNSTMSSWDVVVDHTMNQWTHEKGTNSVTTPTTVSAGWQLSKDRYSDIDLIFKIDGAQKANPYAGINAKSVLIGAESLGMYPKGYAVTVFQMETEAWVQVHYINNSINANFVCGICEWVDGQSIRVVIEGKTLSIYINGIKRDITIQDFSTRSEVELPDYNGGSIGILNWDDAQIQTTFTFEEFTGTKI